MSDDPEKLIRPVKCHFCGQPMFYAGDARWVPEVRVSVHEPYAEVVCRDAHVSCWNERMGK